MKRKANTVDGSPPVIYYYIGKQVQACRESAEITQNELAERCGVGRTTIVHLEEGRQRISIEYLYRIAMALGIEPGKLLPMANKRLLLTKEEAFLEYLNQKEGEE